MTGDTPQFLFSPGWPELYQHNLDCSWVIRSPSSIVEFNLLSLDMEDEVSCLHDSLDIRDGRGFVTLKSLYRVGVPKDENKISNNSLPCCSDCLKPKLRYCR